MNKEFYLPQNSWLCNSCTLWSSFKNHNNKIGLTTSIVHVRFQLKKEYLNEIVHFFVVWMQM